MKHKTHSNILFALLWFGVSRQDTFAELIGDHKTSAAGHQRFDETDDPNFYEPEQLLADDAPQVIVEIIVHQIMHFPIKHSNRSSHVRDIFLSSSSSQRAFELADAYANQGREIKEVSPVKTISNPVGNSKNYPSTAASRPLSFNELLRPLASHELSREKHDVPYSDPLSTLAPADQKSYEYINDLFLSESDEDSRVQDTDQDTHQDTDQQTYLSPASQNSYRDLLLALSAKNVHDFSFEENTSNLSPLETPMDYEKSAANLESSLSSSYDEITSNETSFSSNSTAPYELAKFLKSILPILFSSWSFDITFSNATELEPLTATV